jgi:hypothetical protein
MTTLTKWNVVKLALAIAMASVPQSTKGDTIENCTGGDTSNVSSNVPCYMINLNAPSGDNHIESQFFPISGNLFGIDPRGVGSGSALGSSGFGRVGAKTDVTNNSPTHLGVPVVASASAEFDDFFSWNGAPAQLRFTMNLVGDAKAPADPLGSTFAAGEAKLLLETSVDKAGGDLLAGTVPGGSGPRTTTVTIHLAGTDLLFLDLNLGSAVGMGVFGGGHI